MDSLLSRAAVLRRTALTLLAGTLALTLGVSASAQNYPNKPIRLVVTFPSGGAPDILARLFSEKAQLGQPVVVDNKPGAGGNIGADFVAKSAGDGYTLVLGTVGTHSINGSLYEKMPYDMVKNFSPVSLIASAPNLLVVNNNVPVKTVPEFVAYLKANPNKLSFGSPGVGTSVHVSGELFKSMTGTQMTHVPYKGASAAATDLVAGQVQVSVQSLPSSIAFIRSGKMKVLGVVNPKRLPALPDAPTIGETVKGFGATPWYGMFAPAGTPKHIVTQLNAEIAKALESKDVQERLAGVGCEPFKSTPEQFAQLVRDDLPRWAKIVKESGATID